MKADLHVGRLDIDCLSRLSKFGFDTVLIEQGPASMPAGGPIIYRFKYDPEKERGAPIIKLGAEFQYKDFMTYLKSHPNKTKAALFDLRDLRAGIVTPFMLNRVASQLLRRNIPVFFASGALAGDELVPPIILDTLTKYLVLHRDMHADKKYREFARDMSGIIRSGNYFETY